MKIIVLDRDGGRSTTLHFSQFSRRLLGAGLALFPLLVGFAAYGVAKMAAPEAFSAQVALWQQQLSDQAEELESVEQKSQREIDALAARMAELQARLIRLDAMGERMVEVAKLDKGEFDFSRRPAVGGIAGDELEVGAYNIPSLSGTIDQLQKRLDERQRQLEVLDSLLADKKFSNEVKVSGWPVESGWISSHYGPRNDPFDGRRKMHEGMDFASREGAGVMAMASGVVTWVGNKEGYGMAVEINHGNGYLTRYTHNQENLLVMGDTVKKGETIALVGNSGRSTGPHVHFEVYKHGRVVDPATYIRRNRS
jgi:murein DD-endopeptidase MepM/ murein hydrolase activator NlpD